MQVATEQNRTNPEVSLGSVIGRVARAMQEDLPPGELASLRRLDPDYPYSPGVWRLLVSFVPDSWLSGPEMQDKERCWACIFMGMSHAIGAHDPHASLGAALAKAKWSELRFVRLLRERGVALFRSVRLLARYLASKDQSANWADIAILVLNQEGERAQRHRHRIARDFYRALYVQEATREGENVR